MTARRTWSEDTIADFRTAFAALRKHPVWADYDFAAKLLGYKSPRGLRWAAGEYHNQNWPGSYRLARQLAEVYDGIFVWQPPQKYTVPACPDCGSVHTGRCHNQPVASVVVLGPGERVVRETATVKRKRDARATIHFSDQLGDSINRKRLARHLTWEQVGQLIDSALDSIPEVSS